MHLDFYLQRDYMLNKMCIRDSSYPNHYVTQQYLPNNLKNRTYYEYGDNKFERATKDYWDKIKK